MLHAGDGKELALGLAIFHLHHVRTIAAHWRLESWNEVALSGQF